MKLAEKIISMIMYGVAVCPFCNAPWPEDPTIPTHRCCDAAYKAWFERQHKGKPLLVEGT